MDKPQSRKIIASLLLIFTITTISYLPVFKCDFTNWDDQVMVTQNVKITGLSWQNIKTIFTEPHERLYHPLVLLSYAIEYQFFGLNPHVFHTTNLVLHLLNSLLVFWLIYLLTQNLFIALIVGLLFGIHPLHVESVAWITERKDVLYALFFLGSLISYLYYEKIKQVKPAGPPTLKVSVPTRVFRPIEKFYFHLSLILFLCSLLSKPMSVTLPVILLLFDFLDGKKLEWKLVKEKAGFFILALFFGLLTIATHFFSGYKANPPALPLSDFFFIGNYGILFYLGKFLLPLKLSTYYPLPEKTGGFLPLHLMLSPLINLGILAAIIYSLKFTRKIAFGFLFFLFSILPVLQLFPTGLGIHADRYTYIPLIGFFFILAAAINFAYEQKGKFSKALAVSSLILIILILSTLTWQKTKVWQNSMTLWNDVIKNYPNSAIAYYNRGNEYFFEEGNYNKAIADFSLAIKYDPEYSSAYINRGLCYFYLGKYDRAIADYNKAIEIKPTVSEAWCNRGNAYSAKKNFTQALADYNQAIKLNPDYTVVYYNRGNIYTALQNYDQALAEYDRALEINPDYTAAYNNRGNTNFAKGDYNAAIVDFSRTISLNPGYAEAYYNRSVSYLRKNNYGLAFEDARRAFDLGYPIDKKYLDTLHNLWMKNQ